MLTISGSILLGVISGLLASLVVWIVIALFKSVILPWYQSFIYQGLKISGYWIGFYADKGPSRDMNDPHYTVFIKQKGAVIEGSLTRNQTQNGQRDLKEFQFNGVFKDGNLVLVYKPKDETRLGSGSYVMTLTDDGRKLEGTSLYIASNNRGKVAQFSVLWMRKPN